MSIVSNEVTINLQHKVAEETEYHGAITTVKAVFSLTGEKVGFIRSTLVNRNLIPIGYMYITFREYSETLQRIGCALMEPRLGRTRLKSLAQYDDPQYDFLLIEKFFMTPKYKQNDELKTIILYKFLHHPFIKGNLENGHWKVSSVAYDMDPCEVMSHEERKRWMKHRADCDRLDEIRSTGQVTPEMQTNTEEAMQWDIRMDTLAQQCAIPFLRNGFFQDQAIINEEEMYSWFLVTSSGHFCKPIQPEEDVDTIELYPKLDPSRTEKDCELNSYMVMACYRCRCNGLQTDMDRANQPSIVTIKHKVQDLVDAGASISRAGALHIACKENAFEIVKVLLEIDPDAINTFDVSNSTPLMNAADSIARRSPYDSILDTRVIDLLLSKGADTALIDRGGMTAYGCFVGRKKWYNAMLHMTMGVPFGYFSAIGSWAEIPTDRVQALQERLISPCGLSEIDLIGAKQGIMDYEDDDYGAMTGEKHSDELKFLMMRLKMIGIQFTLGA